MMVRKAQFHNRLTELILRSRLPVFPLGILRPYERGGGELASAHCSVGAYLGLVPARDQSGNSDPREKRISKEGDEMLRRLLVSGAHYILGPFGSDSDLRRHGQKIASRGGKN